MKDESLEQSSVKASGQRRVKAETSPAKSEEETSSKRQRKTQALAPSEQAVQEATVE